MCLSGLMKEKKSLQREKTLYLVAIYMGNVNLLITKTSKVGYGRKRHISPHTFWTICHRILFLMDFPTNFDIFVTEIYFWSYFSNSSLLLLRKFWGVTSPSRPTVQIHIYCLAVVSWRDGGVFYIFRSQFLKRHQPKLLNALQLLNFRRV